MDDVTAVLWIIIILWGSFNAFLVGYYGVKYLQKRGKI